MTGHSNILSEIKANVNTIATNVETKAKMLLRIYYKQQLALNLKKKC